jgi:hypothetical protein
VASKSASRERGAGRPTKKERRDIKEFTRDTGGDE